MREERLFQEIARVTRLARLAHQQQMAPHAVLVMAEKISSKDGQHLRLGFEAAYQFYLEHHKYLKTKASLRDVFVLARERAVDAVRDELHTHEEED